MASTLATPAASASSTAPAPETVAAPAVAAATTAPQAGLEPADISSPHQLIDWVDTVLAQLETRFDDMNSQVTSRMSEMSTRIDALESSIQDLIHGTTSPIASQPDA